MSTTAEMIEQGTATDLLTTELNSLANNTLCSAGSAFNNVQGTSNFNAYPRASVQFTMATYIGTPSASAALYVWFLKSIDANSTYEDSTSARDPDVIIPIGAVASGPQKITMRDVKIPVGYFKAIAKNVGTGLTMASSGNKITILPSSYQDI